MLQLTTAIDSVISDGSGVTLLRASAGMGKTTMLASALEQAQRHQWRTLVVAPDVASRSVPLAALLDAVAGEQFGVDVAELERTLGSSEAPYWFTRAFSEAIQRSAMDEPMLIVVDDLQWLDAASAAVLASLVQGLEGEQIAWLFATRTGAPSAAHLRLIRLAEAHHSVIDLGPLSHEAAVAVASDLLGSPPGPMLENSLERTSRIPLLIVEMMRGLRDEDLLVQHGAAIESSGDHVPSRFGASSRERLTHLTDTALRFLQIASLIGRRFRLVDVLDVLGMTTRDSADVVEELVQSEVLADVGDHLEFVHDTLREGAEATLTPSLKRGLAREVVRVRLAAGDPVGAIASTLIDAAEPGDEQSFTLLHDAALSLAALDAAEAARLATEAVRLARDVPRFAAPAAELVPLLWAGGFAEQAERSIEVLTPYLRHEERAQTLLSLARQQTASSFETAIRTVDSALTIPGITRSTRTELLAVRALNAANKADPVELRDTLAMAREVADPDVDFLALATIDATESVFEFNNGRWTSALALIEQALSNIERAGLRPNLWAPEGLWLAFLRNSMGHPEAALALTDAGRSEASSSRNAPVEAYWQMVRSRALFDLGRLDDARLQAEAVLILAEELGLEDFAQATAGIVLAKIAVHTGDRALAASIAPVIRRLADGAGVTRAGRWTLAYIAMDEGRTADAFELSALARSSLADPIPPMTTPVDFADDLVLMEILLAADDTAGLTLLEEVVTRRAAMNPTELLPAAVRDAVLGRLRHDPSLLAAARAALHQVDRPLVRARVREMSAIIDDGDAVAHLEEALSIYEAAGATRDASRVLQGLRSRGVQRRFAQNERSELLSARETQVLEKLVDGATTQQIADALFVSSHTVVSHIRHIYSKLGVNTRKGLVQQYADAPLRLKSGPGATR